MKRRRFRGPMLPHRRLSNRVRTGWVRWLALQVLAQQPAQIGRYGRGWPMQTDYVRRSGCP